MLFLHLHSSTMCPFKPGNISQGSSILHIFVCCLWKEGSTSMKARRGDKLEAAIERGPVLAGVHCRAGAGPAAAACVGILCALCFSVP